MILLSAARSFPYKNSLTLFHPYFCASTKITDLRAPLPTRLGLLFNLRSNLGLLLDLGFIVRLFYRICAFLGFEIPE